MTPAEAVAGAPGVPADPDDLAREEIARGILDLAVELNSADRAPIIRDVWRQIGVQLLKARDSFGGNQVAFGAWVEKARIAEIAGLKSPASRSDAIWCVEFSDRAGLIPDSICNPRNIRAAWRKLYRAQILASSAALLAETAAPQDPDVAAAAEPIVEITRASEQEAFHDLQAEILAQLDGSHEARRREAMAVAMRAAMAAAHDAGVAAAEVCTAGNVLWGGQFRWTVTPQKLASELDAGDFAKVMKAKGVKLTAVMAMLSEVYGV